MNAICVMFRSPRDFSTFLEILGLPDLSEDNVCHALVELIALVTGLRPQSGSGLRAQTTAPMEAGLRLYSCAPRSSYIYS